MTEDLTFIFQKHTAADIAGGQSLYQQQERVSRSQTMSSMTLNTPLCYGDDAAVMVTDCATELLNGLIVSLCVCVCIYSPTANEQCLLEYLR